MKLVPYKGVRVRKTKPGEIEQIKATIKKIKARQAIRKNISVNFTGLTRNGFFV